MFKILRNIILILYANCKTNLWLLYLNILRAALYSAMSSEHEEINKVKPRCKWCVHVGFLYSHHYPGVRRLTSPGKILFVFYPWIYVHSTLFVSLFPQYICGKLTRSCSVRMSLYVMFHRSGPTIDASLAPADILHIFVRSYTLGEVTCYAILRPMLLPSTCKYLCLRVGSSPSRRNPSFFSNTISCKSHHVRYEIYCWPSCPYFYCFAERAPFCSTIEYHVIV